MHLLGYERNRNLKALTKNLPGIRLLVSVLGLRKFQISGKYSVIGFTIGPSGAVQTVSDSRRPLFSIFFFFLVVTAFAKTPEGVVVGFQIFAWAPK